MDTSEQPRKISKRGRRLRYFGRRAAAGAAIVAAVALAMLADRAGLFGRAGLPDEQKFHHRQFKVVKVIDGDTLDVDCPDGPYPHTRIRLLGVDTPETVKPDTPIQHYGPEAADYLREITLGQTVTLELDRLRTRDRHQRLLAYIILPDGVNVNLAIVAAGFGYADPRFRHPVKRDFARAQREARHANLGLWRDLTQQQLPYYYRDKLKLPPRPATAPASP